MVARLVPARAHSHTALAASQLLKPSGTVAAKPATRLDVVRTVALEQRIFHIQVVVPVLEAVNLAGVQVPERSRQVLQALRNLRRSRSVKWSDNPNECAAQKSVPQVTNVVHKPRSMRHEFGRRMLLWLRSVVT